MDDNYTVCTYPFSCSDSRMHVRGRWVSCCIKYYCGVVSFHMKCLRMQIMRSLAARTGKIIANGACRSVKMFVDVSGAYVALRWIRLAAATPHLLVSQSFIGYRRTWESALCWVKCGLLKCQKKTRLWCPTVTSTVFMFLLVTQMKKMAVLWSSLVSLLSANITLMYQQVGL